MKGETPCMGLIKSFALNTVSAQLHSSHTLVKSCSKFFKPGFSNTWTTKFQKFKLVLEKAVEPEIKLPTSAGSLIKQESFRKTSISALLTMPKPLTVWHEVAQSCLTLCDLVDCSLTDSSVHEIFQAIVLEWIAIFINCGKFFKRREYQTT